MVRKLNMVLFLTLAIVGMLHSCLAQTTHVVGDALGWTIPPGGEVAYRTWAANQTFTVGDVLVFNYATGTHDVAEVSKDSFDSCNATAPISMSTNGPTRITLTSAGERHFICTFTRHCEAGQKLAINVTAASPAPAPQPPTPAPVATPETSPSPVATPETSPSPVATPAPAQAPAPSRVGMTYTVGDSLGWTVPPGGPVAYQTWARGKSFMVGDILVFNFTSGQHDVAEVTKAEFDSCNASSSTTIITTGPARITLTSAGEHHYICTLTQHCPFGQKLAINVTGSAPAPSSGRPTPPPSSTTPPSSSGGPSTSPSTPSTPSPDTTTPPPPPGNSAPSFAVAALPLTFLAIALAFLYN